MVVGLALMALLGCASGSGSVRPGGQEVRRPPSVIGAVLDVDSGKRLPSCSLVVLGTRIGTQTDQNGRFRLSLPDASVWTIQAQAPGYRREIRSLSVVPGHFDTLVFRLKWQPPVYRQVPDRRR